MFLNYLSGYVNGTLQIYICLTEPAVMWYFEPTGILTPVSFLSMAYRASLLKYYLLFNYEINFLNSDGQQFLQFQQIGQSPLTAIH